MATLNFQGPRDQLAETINEFFVSVSAHLPPVDSAILQDLTRDYPADFVIDPVDVENRLPRINIYKAPGPDSLPNWLLHDRLICAKH